MTNYEREIVNGELENGAGNGHTSKGFEAVEIPLSVKQGRKYELLSAGSTTESTSSGNSQWKNLNKYALCCALLASLNSTLLGYDIGVISGAIIFIKQDLGITEVQEELLVGSLNLVSLLGAASSGRIADAVGRRWTMAIAALFFLVGAATMGFAPAFSLLMVGRILAGIGVGFALMVAPVYTAEVSPASSRGSLVSLPEVFINIGILLGYIVSYSLAGLPAHVGWRLMLGIGVLPALCLAFGVFLMPESPRWLVMQNRIAEAEIVLLKTSSDKAEANIRLVEILEAAGHVRPDVSEGQSDMGWTSSTHVGANNQGQGVWKELLWPTPPVRRMLILALGVQFFQQASGIDAIVYYSPMVFNWAGVAGTSGLLLATIAVGFSKTLFILVATIWLDRLGRRPLLLTSAAGITVSLLTLGVGFLFLHVTPTDDIPEIPLHAAPHVGGFVAILAILAICSYVSFFSIGFGPVNWVLTSEIFPLRLRAQAMGLGIVVNRLVSGTVALTFLSMAEVLTIAGTFFLFSAAGALSFVFLYVFTPETKGKTLEEIATFFERDSDRIQPSLLVKMESLPRNGNGIPSAPLRNITKEPDVDEEDLRLMEHDALAATDESAARKQLLMRVKSIAKQGLPLDSRNREQR